MGQDREIDIIDDLRAHLLTAVQLEQATIPVYLCALYSIPEGTNLEASTVIRSVVMEEMLHMTLAANVLNALGDHVPIVPSDFTAPYPKFLPHSNKAFEAVLLPFSKAALEVFLKIEKPAAPNAKPQGNDYSTIGQFYAAIEIMLRKACDERGEKHVFVGDPARQARAGRWYYGGGGDVIEVHDLESAVRALKEVTEQGEGIDFTIEDSDQLEFDDVGELAHYFRFKELLNERRYRALDTPKSGPSGDEIVIDWTSVAPMRPNPRVRDYDAYPAIQRQMRTFNEIYNRLLASICQAFNGTPDALGIAAPIMYELRYQAQALMNIPSPLEHGKTVGPSFESTDA